MLKQNVLFEELERKKCSQCREVKPLVDFHKSCNSCDGRTSECAECKNLNNRLRRRGKLRGSLSVETKVLELRKELKSSSQILTGHTWPYPLTVQKINEIINRHYGDNDPLKKYILERIKEDEPAKQIARRLHIQPNYITKLAQKHGIDLWERAKKRKGWIGITKKEREHRAPERRLSIAEDLYCYYLDDMSLEEIALETGFVSSTISKWLKEYIPQYRKESEERLAASLYNKLMKRLKRKSVAFPKEKAFALYCQDILKQYTPRLNVRDLAYMEIDMYIEAEIPIVIELKVVSVKPVMATALGQVITVRQTFKGECQPIICFPNDVHIDTRFKDMAKEIEVIVCNSDELMSIVDGISN